jgi:hypothetical protein
MVSLPLALVGLIVVLPLDGGELPADDARCLECHSVGELRSVDALSGREYRLAIDVDAYERSSHATVGCTTCHDQGYHRVPHRNARRRDPFQCLSCHQDDAHMRNVDPQQRKAAVKESVHWEKNGSVFGCHACHDPHRFRPPPLSQEGAEHIAWANAICSRCHEETPLKPFEKAKAAQGAHGFLPHEALHLRVTSCIDCHGEERLARHRINKASEAPSTCKACHGGPAHTLTANFGKTLARDGESNILNRDVLDDVYVIGSTKSALLDRVSQVIFFSFVALLVLHAIARVVVSWRGHT